MAFRDIGHSASRACCSCWCRRDWLIVNLGYRLVHFSRVMQHHLRSQGKCHSNPSHPILPMRNLKPQCLNKARIAFGDHPAKLPRERYLQHPESLGLFRRGFNSVLQPPLPKLHDDQAAHSCKSHQDLG